MTKLCGLVGSWLCGLALVGVGGGCTPRTDIGVGPDDGSGGEGVTSPQAGSGGKPTDAEGGSPQGGSSGSDAGSSAAAGGDVAGGNGGSITSSGASGTSGIGGDSGSAGTGGNAGSGGSSGNAGSAGSAGTGGSGSVGDGELLCGTLGNLDASSGLLLNLGLTRPIEWFERTDDRLLATDTGGNWALWNLTDKTILARGRAEERVGDYCAGCPRPDLAGGLFTLASAKRLEVRSLFDGSLITTIDTPDGQENQGGLSPDGSYYWSGTYDSIQAWDESGTLLLTRNGNYAAGSDIDGLNSLVSAALDELRIARGPAGNSVIERISIDTGASTTSPFAGSFSKWFLDGGRFLTVQAGALRVYAADTATQEALAAIPNLGLTGGQGDYFWNAAGSDELWIYAVANPSSPVAKYPVSGQDPYTYPYGRYYAVGNRIGLVHKTNVTVVELGPTGITDSTIDLPASPAQWWTYTGDAAGNHALANSRGVIYDTADPDHALSCGELTDLAGSEQGALAVATSVGLLLFELKPDAKRHVARIPFARANVSLSRDGGVLAASSLDAVRVGDSNGETTLAIWSVPDREVIQSRSFPPGISDVTLSALGNRFSYNGRVEDFAGNVSLTSSQATAMRLSPDGSRVAVRLGELSIYSSTTQLYEDGTLFDAFDGVPALWLDQDHLVVNAFDRNNPDFQNGVRIYAIPGGFQPGPKLDFFFDDDAAMLSPTEIYYGHSNNSVYSLATGELLWSGAPADKAAVASSNIVFAIGNQIMFSAY